MWYHVNTSCDTRYLFNLASSVGGIRRATTQGCYEALGIKLPSHPCRRDLRILQHIQDENATLHGLEPNHHTFILDHPSNTAFPSRNMQSQALAIATSSNFKISSVSSVSWQCVKTKKGTPVVHIKIAGLKWDVHPPKNGITLW